MAQAVSCPDRLRLQKYLLGNVSAPEADQIEKHLADCKTCEQMLDTLYARDPELEGVTSFSASNISGTEQVVIDGLINKVRQLRSPHSSSWQENSTINVSRSEPSTEQPTNPPTPGWRVDDEIIAMLSPPERDDEMGRLGSYRILKILGMGGMGVVFQAEDPTLRRMVALKVMKPAMGWSAAYRERFLHEARTMAALEHDHIVPIFQVGEDRDILFLALPMLKGETLEDRLAKNKALGWLEILRISGEIARGLAAAHELGIIHRDIKPSNLWLEAGGDRVKILDFGLAHPVNDQGKELERQSIVGTPAYMSPEQARSQPLDARSDLFSLGCVLYRLCTGTPPFEKPDKLSLMMAVVADHPRPVRELKPDCPPELANLVMQLLAKDCKDRPTSATSVADTAERIRRGILQAPLRRRLKIAAAVVLVGLLAWTSVTWGPWLYLVAANQAVVSLESEDETATVLVMQDDRVIAELHPAKHQRIKVAAGQLKLEIQGDPDGLQLAADVLVVGRGDEEKVIVRRVPFVRGQLTFDAEEPLKIALHRGGNHVATLTLPAVGSFELPAGDYDVQLLDQAETLRAYPGRVTVEAGERSKIRISSVGEIRRIDKADAAVNSVAVDSQGKFVLAGISGPRGAVGLWSVKSGDEIFYKMKEHSSPVAAVALSRDGKYALSGGGMKGAQPDLIIRHWDVAKASVVGQLEGSPRIVTCLAFAKDPDVAISGSGNTISIWSLQEQRETRSWAAHRGGIHCVAVMPEGDRVVTGGAAVERNGEIHLWNLDNGKLIRSYAGHTDPVRSIAVSADGLTLVSGSSDGTVRCWDVPSAKELHVFSAHKGVIHGVAISSDGKRVVSAGSDGTVRLFDVQSHSELLRFDGHKGAVHCVAFLPDGRHAISGGKDQQIRVWKLP